MLWKPTRDVATVEMAKGPLCLLSTGKQRPISAANSVDQGSQGGPSVEYLSEGQSVGEGDASSGEILWRTSLREETVCRDRFKA